MDSVEEVAEKVGNDGSKSNLSSSTVASNIALLYSRNFSYVRPLGCSFVCVGGGGGGGGGEKREKKKRGK